MLVALAAAQQLAREHVEMTFRVHGGFNFQSEAFQQAFFDALQSAGPGVSYAGAYAREDIPELMSRVDWVVVPSVWWENALLVILEAMQHGRPVICSDIGGLAEMVGNERTGLHFRAGDASDLARTMLRAAVEPGLWQRLARRCRSRRDFATPSIVISQFTMRSCETRRLCQPDAGLLHHP